MNVATSHPDFGVQLGVVPFDRSYVVLPGRLYGGFYPASHDANGTIAKLERLVAVGIRHVVNLTEEGEGSRTAPLRDYFPELGHVGDRLGAPISFRRFAIRDGGIPDVVGMVAALDEVDRALAAGLPTYVHCWGGRGRTATVLGCYLARHGHANGDRALAMIRYLRRTDGKAEAEAPETPVQKDFVRGWPVGR